jgi:hypothetical protein
MPPKTKAVKANIDKYIFLFSKHSSKQSYTDTNSVVRNVEYAWNIEPQTINEQSTLELVQKDFSNYGEETATGTVVFGSASSISVIITNPLTNGYYTTPPTVTFTGATGSGAVGTAVLTSGRVSSVTMSGTMTGYVAATLPTVSISAPTTFGITPYMIRINNLHSGSIIHSTDDGGTGNTIKKGMIIDMSYPFQDITEAIKMVLEQQTINRIVISVDNTFSEIKGLPSTTDFVLCFKLAEYEPKPLSYGSMNNVNVNQQQ